VIYPFKKLWQLYGWAGPQHGMAWAIESKAVEYDDEDRV
jgi:hypothetical protein